MPAATTPAETPNLIVRHLLPVALERAGFGARAPQPMSADQASATDLAAALRGLAPVTDDSWDDGYQRVLGVWQLTPSMLTRAAARAAALAITEDRAGDTVAASLAIRLVDLLHYYDLPMERQVEMRQHYDAWMGFGVEAGLLSKAEADAVRALWAQVRAEG